MAPSIVEYYLDKLRTLDPELLKVAIDDYARNLSLSRKEAAQDCKGFWKKLFPYKKWALDGEYNG